MQVSKKDCAVWMITFIGCLTVSIDLGLAMGVAAGLLLLFHQISFPEISMLSRLHGSEVYVPDKLYHSQVCLGPFLPLDIWFVHCRLKC